MSFQMCCAASDRPPDPVHVEVYTTFIFSLIPALSDSLKAKLCSFLVLSDRKDVYRRTGAAVSGKGKDMQVV